MSYIFLPSHIGFSRKKETTQWDLSSTSSLLLKNQVHNTTAHPTPACQHGNYYYFSFHNFIVYFQEKPSRCQLPRILPPIASLGWLVFITGYLTPPSAITTVILTPILLLVVQIMPPWGKTPLQALILPKGNTSAPRPTLITPMSPSSPLSVDSLK